MRTCMSSSPRFFRPKAQSTTLLLVLACVIAFVFIVGANRLSPLTISLQPASPRVGAPPLPRDAQWEGTGISESSQGKTWKARRFRNYPATLLHAGGLRPEAPVPYARLGRRCKNWAVVTTIFAPTKMASQLAALPDWCAVFVGDKKSPPAKVWTDEFPPNRSRIVFLDVDAQLSLPYRTVGNCAWNHFSRKNIGFIYAIHHGAKFIYDTDDDNVLLNDGELLTNWTRQLASTMYPEWRTTHHLVNPYATLGSALKPSGKDTFVWQRGFPLPFVRDERTMKENETLPSYRVTGKFVGVVQSVANHDPDVDAIYRLTQPLPLIFTAVAKHVVVPEGTMSPFNAQAVIFARSAFWGLLLPASVHGRVSDIWRAYFTQRLMWDLNLRVLFTSPFVNQFRNAHDYLADFNSESPLYTHSGELVKFLLQWRPHSSNVESCMEELIVAMYELGVVEIEDVHLTQSWITDLLASGYKFPKITSSFNVRPIDEPRIVDGRDDK
jgi:hypothetical protein